MFSIKRRLGVLAVAAGAGLAAIVGTGTAAHAGTLGWHTNPVPGYATLTMHFQNFGDQAFNLPQGNMTDGGAPVWWHYTWAEGCGTAYSEWIDTWLEMKTDQWGNLHATLETNFVYGSCDQGQELPGGWSSSPLAVLPYGQTVHGYPQDLISSNIWDAGHPDHVSVVVEVAHY
jgi:hypothetical protein